MLTNLPTTARLAIIFLLAMPTVALGLTLNDASGLNKTEVAEIVTPKSEQDIRAALKRAPALGLKVSIGGSRHSMGGHTLGNGRIVLDMSGFDAVYYDSATTHVVVQSGATWAKVLGVLDKVGRSVRVMQSNNVFSIGGSLSVNVHGWQAKSPPLVSTVESFRIMLSSGEVVSCSRSENPVLFSAVIGGYGLFGVILDVRFRTTHNETYLRRTSYFDASLLPGKFAALVDRNPAVEMAYGRLSIEKDRFLTDASIQIFEKSAAQPAKQPPMRRGAFAGIARSVFQAEENGDRAKRRRWLFEKQYYRSQEGKAVTRNTILNTDLAAYWPAVSGRHDILHEYFVPLDKYEAFRVGLRKIVPGHRANLLNATIRDVRQDSETLLPFATRDSFAFVLFFSQGSTSPDEDDMHQLTAQLIDLAESLGGSFYLPYRLHYTRAQLQKAYPAIDRMIELKHSYDPGELFSSTFYEHIK